MTGKRYKTYPKYKPSGITWLGDIPAQWERGKAYCFFNVFSGGTPKTDEPLYWDGDIPWINSGKVQDCIIDTPSRHITQKGLENSSTRMMSSERTVLAMTGATCANVGFLKISTCANQSVMTFQNKREYNQKFLFYYLLSQRKQVESFKTGGAQGGISADNGKNLYVVLPSVLEQEKIAAFLDIKTGNIDTLLSKLEKQLKLIDEQRNSLITEAICKGINPKAPMKASGIEWLGNIPKHWDIKKLKHVVKNNVNKINSGPFRIIDLEHICSNAGQLSLPSKDLPTVEMNTDRLVFSKDNILYGKLRPYLKKVLLASFHGYCSSEILVLSPLVGIPKFYYYLFLSQIIDFLSTSTSYGVKMPRASWEVIGKCSVSLPPTSEQEEIVKYLDEKVAKIDAIKSKTLKQIDLLKEYKASLITNVVTGKIDVRDEVI